MASLENAFGGFAVAPRCGSRPIVAGPIWPQLEALAALGLKRGAFSKYGMAAGEAFAG